MRKITGLFLILCIAFGCAGCKSEKLVAFTAPSSFETVNSGLLAENSRYVLDWDDELKCVLLREKATGAVWSSIPYAAYESGNISYNLSSSVSVEYYNTEDGSVQVLKSADCVDNGTVKAEKIKNGIAVTWYFTEAEISLTTNYVLRDTSLSVSVPANSISEGNISRLLNFSLVPYLCAVENTEDKSDYLFVPSGSGAIMYTDEAKGSSRKYEEEVYGTDPVKSVLDYSGNEEAIRLPVFGAKGGEYALCGIIEENDGAASISAVAGDERTHYSAAYATFNVRGYNMVEHGQSDTVLLSKSRPLDGSFSVGYYPLSSDSADYSGMAECFRNYLLSNNMLEKSEVQQQKLHLTLVGGELTDEYTLGIPHKTLLKLTDFSQAEKAVKELSESIGTEFEVTLEGFDDDPRKIAGGYGYSGKLGGDSGKASLEKLCLEKGISLYTDFDIINFSKSGSGFNKLLNAALTANSQSAVLYPRKINVGTDNTDKEKNYLLKRDLLSRAIERLIEFTEKNCSGISLDSLGNTAYSDYSTEEYAIKGAVAKQTAELLKSVKSNHSLHLSAANGYCAGLADSVSDVPLQNGGYNGFDATVPFYSMVFKGYTALYSAPVNLSPNSTEQLLRAVEGGVMPSYRLCASVGPETAYLTENKYYGLSLESNTELISETVKKLEDYYRLTVDSAVKHHSRLSEGVTETVFDNGVTVLVNHTDVPVTYGSVTLQAEDFSVIGG